MTDIKYKFYLKIILIISLIALISAFFIEHILGHKPCNLCLIERIPYGISIVLIVTVLTLKKNVKFFIILLILTFIFSLSISIYHFGIEKGFFQESVLCNAQNFNANITKDELLKQLAERTISCKDVTFMIFGLSLTGINIVLSIFFTITLAKIFFKYEKNGQ